MLTIPQFIGLIIFIIITIINLNQPLVALAAFACTIITMLCALQILPQSVGLAAAGLLIVVTIMNFAA